ncbi:MAG: hypothetical protein ABI658_31825, partial [Acidimicrobiales bacterium]
MLLGGMMAALLLVGAVKDAVFVWVVVTDAVIGIIQEVRSKRTLDRLAIVAASKVDRSRWPLGTD